MRQEQVATRPLNEASTDRRSTPPLLRAIPSAPEADPAPVTQAVIEAGPRGAAPVAERARARPWSRAAMETLTVTIALPTIAWLVGRPDVFFLGGRFPWLLFAPLLVGLRHGLALGLASAVALDASIVIAWRAHLASIDAFPGELAVALMVVAMLAGQFADRYRGALVRREAENDALRAESDDLARWQFLLQLSHDRLDQQLNGQSGSLRDAVALVRDLAERAPDRSYDKLGESIMHLFGAHCMVEVGQLCMVDRGEISGTAAFIGRPSELSPSDPLVKLAIASKRLAYVPAGKVAGGGSTALLAVVPFVGAGGEVTAVLCVEAMPFLSFEKKNLETMFALAGLIARLLEDEHSAALMRRVTVETFAGDAGQDGVLEPIAGSPIIEVRENEASC